MRSNRVVAVAVVVGLVIVGVTFLGAAKPDENPRKDGPKVIRSVKNSSTGVVFYGYGDTMDGLLRIFPETLPQPSKVVKVLVKEGQFVRKNDVLIEFEPEFSDLTVEEARAGLAQAEATLKQAEATVELAEQVMKTHEGLIQESGLQISSKDLLLKAAETELTDKKRIAAAAGIKDSSDIRVAEKKLEAAQKELDAAKSRLELYKRIDPSANKRKAQGSVEEAKAAINKQKAQLNKALYGQKLMMLRAPVNGKIVRSYVSDGMTFGVQTRVPAFEVQPEGVIIVRAEVDQEWASRVAKGQEALILDDGNSNLRWKGTVIRVGDAFLPKRSNGVESLAINESRYLECIVSVDDIDPKTPLRVGQRVKVGIGID